MALSINCINEKLFQSFHSFQRFQSYSLRKPPGTFGNTWNLFCRLVLINHDFQIFPPSAFWTSADADQAIHFGT